MFHLYVSWFRTKRLNVIQQYNLKQKKKKTALRTRTKYILNV